MAEQPLTRYSPRPTYRQAIPGTGTLVVPQSLLPHDAAPNRLAELDVLERAALGGAGAQVTPAHNPVQYGTFAQEEGPARLRPAPLPKTDAPANNLVKTAVGTTVAAASTTPRVFSNAAGSITWSGPREPGVQPGTFRKDPRLGSPMYDQNTDFSLANLEGLARAKAGIEARHPMQPVEDPAAATLSAQSFKAKFAEGQAREADPMGYEGAAISKETERALGITKEEFIGQMLALSKEAQGKNFNPALARLAAGDAWAEKVRDYMLQKQGRFYPPDRPLTSDTVMAEQMQSNPVMQRSTP